MMLLGRRLGEGGLRTVGGVSTLGWLNTLVLPVVAGGGTLVPPVPTGLIATLSRRSSGRWGVKIDAWVLVGHKSDINSRRRTIGLRTRKLREIDGPTAQMNAAVATTKREMRGLRFTLSTSGTMSLSGPLGRWKD